MNFIFVITNLAGGGAEKVLLTLVDGLTRRGHSVELILLERRIEHSLPENIHLTVLGNKITRGWLGKRWMARALRRHILGGQAPDLVVSALPFANEVCILADLAKHWCRIDNTLGAEIDKLALNNPAKSKRRLQRYLKLYNRRPLIAISDGMIEDLRVRIGVTSRIVKILNPFDLDAIRQAACEICPPRPTRPYVIHVGRFNAQKRHDLLLNAWKAINSNRLLVLLTPAEPILQAMIDERGLTQRVFIAGFQPNPYPWIAGADLLVLCSDHEGFPGVLIEALACGIRVVSTDCPSGPRELLRGDLARWLVPMNDVAALTNRMSAVLLEPRPRITDELDAFSVDSVAARYEALAAVDLTTLAASMYQP